jgi:sterol desaturase/sphingolipid hydroxylase (fatty acid hydroxylase superfamily)
MDRVNYIALAVPFFFIFIGLELIIARRRRLPLYRLNDSLSDLSAGVMQQVVILFWTTTLLGIFQSVYDEYRLVTWSSAVWPWLIAFVGVDFLYYWWHRLSHEVNVLWAVHVVHHSSEEYNLSVALRQAVLSSWTSLPFYLPLAVVGVPPIVYATMVSFSTLYQFWIHTQLVGRIRGPINWIINLPEHHRIHHAVNPQYLDKNYGAIMIIWDRLFGTFREEDETPVYGLTKPLSSWNPLWAQFHYWVEMARMMRDAPRWRDKLLVPFKGPAWTPRGLAKPAAVPLATRPKYDPPLAAGAKPWLVAAFALVVVGGVALMLFATEMPLGARAAGVGAEVLALQAIGWVLERGRVASAQTQRAA